MAVKVKNKETDKSKETIIKYGVSEMVAVELQGKFNPGKVVAMHKFAAAKLVKAKTGKIVDVKLEEIVNNDRIVQDISKGKVHGKSHKDS